MIITKLSLGNDLPQYLRKSGLTGLLQDNYKAGMQDIADRLSVTYLTMHNITNLMMD
jgi:hypothetical protein